MAIDWTSNNKTLICEDCIYKDDRENCLVAGLPDKMATLTFVLEKPEWSSARRGRPLKDQDGRVLKHLMSKAHQKLGDKPPYQVVYAVGKPGRYKPKKKAIEVCKQYALQKIASHREQYKTNYPDDDKSHVIVTMGAKASKAILPDMGGFKKNRGDVQETTIKGHKYYVIPTLGMSNISVKPGVAPLVVDDITYAMKLCRRNNLVDQVTVDEITSNYAIPESEDELRRITEWILNYYDPAKRDHPDEWPIAVDTETNSLDPWRRDSKVLMVSVSWDDQQSTAICLDHPDSPYSEEVARECITKLMGSEKPKVFHNMKFDYQFLEQCEDIKVNNLWWDTLLGEHFLDEDKRGFYNLGALTKPYCKEYSGYKDKIQKSLIEKIKEESIKDVNQQRPDVAQSYLLSPFFPDVKYSPACEREGVQQLLDEEKLDELFGLEKEYIEAHVENDKKGKRSARGKVRRRCKKWGVEYPSTISDRDYAEEIDMDKGYENVPLDVLLVYAATDTDVTRIICKGQLRRAYKQDALQDIRSIMSNLYVPGSVELGKMEYRGVYLNRNLIHETHREVNEAEEKHRKAMQNLVCDPDFNPNSDKQLGKVVTQTLPVDPSDIELTDHDQVSVTGSWIESMVEKYAGKPQGEFLKNLQIHRECTKTQGFLEKFDELSEHDSRLHPSFWLNGTKTGRLSCSDPNLQQVPLWMCRLPELGYEGWNIKQPFTTENPETHAYWQMDISQAEIRVLGAYSKDPDLIKAMREGLDVHSFITAKVFDMEYEEVYNNKDSDPEVKHKRTACKRVVFGTLYGAGVKKIAEQIYGNLSTNEKERDEQIQFAKNVKNTLFNRFSRIKTYVNKTQKEVHRKGYVDTFFGRRRRFRLHHTSGYRRYKAEREAVNFRIQSTSSDLVLSQLIEVGQNIDEISASMQLTVHDSMGGTVPLDCIPKMGDFFDKYVVQRVDEKYPWMPVPFAYDLEVGPTYGEPIDYDLLMTSLEDMNDKKKSMYQSLSERKQSFYHKFREEVCQEG